MYSYNKPYGYKTEYVRGRAAATGLPSASKYIDYDPATLALSDGAAIATLTDSVAGRNATSTNDPIYKTNQVNSLPAIQFSGGSSQYFTLPNLSSLTAGTVHLVVKLNADPPVVFDGLWHLGSDSAAGTRFPFNGDGVIYEQFGSTARKTTVNPTPALTSWRIYSIWSAANDWASHIDGTQIFSTATNTVGFDSAPTLGRSRENASSFYADGYMARLVLYSAKQSASDFAASINFLKSTYGIA